ncbi:helix-turn-helix domain-containing protein [Liquorilactobacillus hordei]|nr:helix-turn-helix domain-containing protein [Liquorilactobacillus hordei]QYH51282.1 helix-turn-helix domain-containing protein [Liquorilactobacillus hordei DSM 19519]
MISQLGISLKKIRREQKLSQKEVADNICSQSMLSAIEHGKYIPNAALLLALCEKLSISLNDISLASDFNISSSQNFNDKLSYLCNQHRYVELKTFLVNSATFDQVQTATQTQAYYYYLGVACLHVDTTWDKARQNLQLAIASGEEQLTVTTLTRVALISLALTEAKAGQKTRALDFLKQATEKIDKAFYEENLNIVFYLAALIYLELDDTKESLKWIQAGIKFSTSHNSHYMLANCYRLLAQIAKKSEDLDQELEAQKRSNLFKHLFAEKVFDDF